MHYKTRTITLQLAAVQQTGKPEIDFEALFSAVRARLHGRRLRCVLSSDPDHSYEGRWKVECRQLSRRKATITITGTCDPYKVNMSTGEKRL